MGLIINQYRFTPKVATITQQSSATSTTSSITIPSGTNGKDILIMGVRMQGADGSNADPVASTPSGWTLIKSVTLSTGTTPTVDSSSAVYWKYAAGTFGSGSSDASASVTPWATYTPGGIAMYTFRCDISPTTVTSFSVNGVDQQTNPASQTVAGSSNSAPMIIIGWYGVNGDGTVTVDPRTFTVSGSAAKDGEINPRTNMYMAYKVYNSSPADVAIDMDDEGNHNTLISFGLSVA